MQRQFPSDYTPDELASEIARLSAVLDRHLIFFECMALLADRIECAATDQNQLKATQCLLDLVRFSGQSFLESTATLVPVIYH